MLVFFELFLVLVCQLQAAYATPVQDSTDNETCIDIIPPNFSKDVSCGSLIAALIDGCDDPIIEIGNYCAKSCQKSSCIDPLSEALFKAQKRPIDASGIGFSAPSLWLIDFGSDLDFIYLQDINGDAMADIIAFGERGVYVAISTGTHFERPKLWSKEFGSSQRSGEWNQSGMSRLLGDLNGDGLDDVIGFYTNGTYVALNDGTSFEPMEYWSEYFGLNKGWNNESVYPRFIMDVDGDGKEDVLGLASSGVYISTSNGTSFNEQQKWTAQFGGNQYTKATHPVKISDVNGDGVPDVIGFGPAGVELAVATGFSFAPNSLVFDAFSTAAGWRSDRHLRFVEDIDGDDFSDIVGMGDGGVFVSHSYGESFEEPNLVLPEFGYYAGNWDVQKHPRKLVDVNGDGLLDIVGFKDKGVIISYNMGLGEFDEPFMAVDWFGADMSAGGWTEAHPRFIGDVNGDGKADFVGFAVEGVYVSTAAIK